MPKAQAIQINWQFTGSAGIMQVEHTADCFGGAWLFHHNKVAWKNKQIIHKINKTTEKIMSVSNVYHVTSGII